MWYNEFLWATGKGACRAATLAMRCQLCPGIPGPVWTHVSKWTVRAVLRQATPNVSNHTPVEFWIFCNQICDVAGFPQIWHFKMYLLINWFTDFWMAPAFDNSDTKLGWTPEDMQRNTPYCISKISTGSDGSAPSSLLPYCCFKLYRTRRARVKATDADEAKWRVVQIWSEILWEIQIWHRNTVVIW